MVFAVCLSIFEWTLISLALINLIHKSQNTPVPYPTMLHSEQQCAHFCSAMEHCGILNRCIRGVVKRFYIFVLFQGASGRQTSWLYLSGNQGFTLISALIRAVLGMRPANERRRYSVTTSLIGWAQAYNQLC